MQHEFNIRNTLNIVINIIILLRRPKKRQTSSSQHRRNTKKENWNKTKGKVLLGVTKTPRDNPNNTLSQ